MKIHRLVNKLNLDWIFNYINRGRTDNMVGGSATHTHTQTTFEISNQKNCYRQGERQKLELKSDVLS